MPLTVGLSVAEFAAVVVGVGLLGRRAGRRDRALADSYRLMVVGVGLGALGLAGTALLAIQGGAGTPDRLAPLAIGLSAGVILVLCGLLRRAHSYTRLLAQRESHFREMAFTDALTGLANRRHLHRVLAEQAASGRQGVLLAIDMDGFKHVNDSRGHDVGDAVLVEVARRLRANLRPGDTAARLGGDEFAVLMWCGTEEAQRVADRLLAVLGAPYEMGGCALGLSASIGLAGRGTAENIPALLRNADLSLRYAKQRGKSRVERYDAAYNTWLRRRTTLEDELRGAIERDELCLVYQPVIELLSGRPIGVETLLRWYHPTLGPVSPAEFIPVAEDAGLIERIDNWVLHQACHQLSRWMADGHQPWLAVNISIRELHLDDYVAQVTEVLRAHRIPPRRLVLEVAEHAVAVDLEEVVDRLSALRETGVRIALDDFGAGYSSLGRLRNLPVDILKIDQMLIVDPVGEVPGPSASLVSVVLELGRTLGLEVIAEGVAQPAQRAVVVAAGGRLGQGELLGRPMPAERFEALLAARSPVPAPRRAQDVGQVDSGREMRQS